METVFSPGSKRFNSVFFGFAQTEAALTLSAAKTKTSVSPESPDRKPPSVHQPPPEPDFDCDAGFCFPAGRGAERHFIQDG